MAKLSELKAQAESLSASGRHDQASRIYEHVLKHLEGSDAIEREFPLYVKAGDVLVALDRPQEALERYRAAATRYAKAGDADAVIELCAKIQTADPGQTSVHFSLAGAVLDHGHIDAARLVLVDFAERTGRQKMVQGLAQLEGRPADTVTVVLRKAIETGLGRMPAPVEPPPVTATPTDVVDEADAVATETVQEPEESLEPEAPEASFEVERASAADDDGAAERLEAEAAAAEARETQEGLDSMGNGLVVLTSESDDTDANDEAQPAASEPSEEAAPSEFLVEHGGVESHEADASLDAPAAAEAGDDEVLVSDDAEVAGGGDVGAGLAVEETTPPRPSVDRQPAPWDRAPEPRVVFRDDKEHAPSRSWVA